MSRSPNATVATNSESSSPTPPVAGDIPDLSHLDHKISLGLILSALTGGTTVKHPVSSVVLRAYVRLVDKAVREYQLARSELHSYRDTPGHVISPLFHAIGHMENCVNALLRALRFADVLRRDKHAPPISRTTATRLRKATDALTGVRHAMEHMDERLATGQVQEGAAVALILGPNRLELADRSIEWNELVLWIEMVHSLAVDFSGIRRTGQSDS